MRNTNNTFERAVEQGGWRTDCARSPLPKGPPDADLIAEGPGWEPAGHDRQPQSGWQYGLELTSTSAGYAGRATKYYWSRVKRPRRR